VTKAPAPDIPALKGALSARARRALLSFWADGKPAGTDSEDAWKAYARGITAHEWSRQPGVGKNTVAEIIGWAGLAMPKTAKERLADIDARVFDLHQNGASWEEIANDDQVKDFRRRDRKVNVVSAFWRHCQANGIDPSGPTLAEIARKRSDPLALPYSYTRLDPFGTDVAIPVSYPLVLYFATAKDRTAFARAIKAAIKAGGRWRVGHLR